MNTLRTLLLATLLALAAAPGVATADTPSTGTPIDPSLCKVDLCAGLPIHVGPDPGNGCRPNC